MAVQRTAAFYLSPSSQRVRPIYVHSCRPWWQAVKVCRHYEQRDRICHLTSNRTVTLSTARSTLLLCFYAFNAIRHQHPATILYLHPVAAPVQRPRKCSGGSVFTHSFAMWSRVKGVEKRDACDVCTYQLTASLEHRRRRWRRRTHRASYLPLA